MTAAIRGGLAASLFASCAIVATPALAEETDPPGEITMSGYVQVVSDYRFRGISLSEGDFALQGSVNVNHASGFYVGAWGSSLEDTPVFGNTEIDLYAGWSGEIASGLTADAGLTYYVYPDGKVGDANLFEPYASLTASLGPATAKLGMAYAWEQDSLGGEDNLYVYADLGTSVPGVPLSLSAHLGYSDGALSPKRITASGTGGGFDWSAGGTYTFSDRIALGASYVGVEGATVDGLSDDAVVATLKLTF